MNYEDLYTELAPLKKAVKDATGKADSASKAALKAIETGNVTDLKKQISILEGLNDTISSATQALKQASEAFDVAAYFSSSDYEKQLVEECQRSGIDVKNTDNGVYEMFPYSVKIAADRQEVTFNRKKFASIRPAFLVKTIKEGIEKLNKASFNGATIAKEFAAAYDTAIAVAGKPAGTPISLKVLYKYLAPTSRARKEYDNLSFAYDVARLYNAHYTLLPDGRSMDISGGRDAAKNGVRVLNSNGNEEMLSTISFSSDKQ